MSDDLSALIAHAKASGGCVTAHIDALSQISAEIERLRDALRTIANQAQAVRHPQHPSNIARAALTERKP